MGVFHAMVTSAALWVEDGAFDTDDKSKLGRQYDVDASYFASCETTTERGLGEPLRAKEASRSRESHLTANVAHCLTKELLHL